MPKEVGTADLRLEEKEGTGLPAGIGREPSPLEMKLKYFLPLFSWGFLFPIWSLVSRQQ